MNCREARQCLSPYLDSELDPTRTFEISEHLRVCDPCRWRFEAEREVERQVLARLRPENMPDAMWRDVVHSVRVRPPTRWRLYAPLAAAAALVFVVWAGWSLIRPSPTAPHWMVQEFLTETGGGRPFVAAMSGAGGTGSITPKDVRGERMPLNPFADLVMDFAGEQVLHHATQLVRFDTKKDTDGSEFVEVRLNCCGEPVILRAARRDQPGRLGEFIGAEASTLAALPTTGKVTIAEREVGEYVVVAVSRHPVTDLLAAMQVQ